MAQKDILEKILMAHGDVFADCVNVFLYGGSRSCGEGIYVLLPRKAFIRGRQGSAASSATGASFRWRTDR